MDDHSSFAVFWRVRITERLAAFYTEYVVSTFFLSLLELGCGAFWLDLEDDHPEMTAR